MPINKRNVKTNTINTNERLVILDNIISTSLGNLSSKELLLTKLNRLIPDKISSRTLDIDLSNLRELIKADKVALDFNKKEGYHYIPDKGYRYFKDSINDEEKQLLLLASSLFSVFEGTPLQEKFSTVVERIISDSITVNTVGGWGDLKFLQLDNIKSSSGSKWVSVLLEAIYEKSTFKMKYKGFGKATKIKNICPYVLKQYQKRWYMVAYDYDCTREEKTNVFALDCIEELELSQKNYFTDSKFCAEDYFKYSIGVWHWHEYKPVKVELEFKGSIEAIMASPIHGSQKAVLSDDRKTLSVTIEVYQSPELETMIRSYGSAVRVISPADLREKILEDARKVIDGIV